MDLFVVILVKLPRECLTLMECVQHWSMYHDYAGSEFTIRFEVFSRSGNVHTSNRMMESSSIAVVVERNFKLDWLDSISTAYSFTQYIHLQFV